MVVGLDIGYGYAKMVYSDGIQQAEFTIPSKVSTYVPKRSFGDSFEVVQVNGKPYIVGLDVDGSSRLGFDFVGKDEYFAVLGFCLSRVNAVKRVLVLGLPPQAYDEERVQVLKEAVRNMEVRTENGRIYLPQRIEFVPQGAGIFFAYITDNGVSDTKKTHVVVDIGYHTMDVVLFSDARYRGHMSRSYPFGVRVLYDMIRDEYIKKYSVFISPDSDALIERFLQDGSVNHMGEIHTLNVKEIVSDFYTARIVKALKDYISDAKEHGYTTEKIILGGGGVSYFGNIAGVHVVRDPQMANARGYMEYGRSLL